MSAQVLVGDVLAVLPTLEAGSVRCCVTSPPYWGLRDYGVAGQIGLEPTPEEYVARMVDVFREVRRVLADDGTLWLNLGDSYATRWGSKRAEGSAGLVNNERTRGGAVPGGLKEKDLVGIPWRVAFALQEDGWYLRSDVIWSKPNPMPESVTDRPTKAHEYVFLLSKSARYFYDAAAIAEAGTGRAPGNVAPHKYSQASDGTMMRTAAGLERVRDGYETRNRRTVWHIATEPFPGAHFATYPTALVEPCILAGSARGDVVLDPFAGSGTTGMVALRHGRGFVGIELNPTYAEMARRRITDDAPLLNEVA